MMTTDRAWSNDEVREVGLELFDERLQRYRLVQPRQERTLAQSLERYGQISPVVICIQEQSLVLVDGFKRLRSARKLKGMERLAARCIEVDEQGAKAAVYNLNRAGQRPVELEESWIVHALVREDGLSQVEAAQLLGRHKSWVNRRLAMLERLCEGAREELRLGLLTPAIARQLTRLPMGNQAAALHATREASLTSSELAGVVTLLLASVTKEQTDFVLSDPRRALRQSEERYIHQWDPRLSTAGNRIAKRLGFLLDGLAKIQTWMRYQGRGELQACDRELLQPGFQRLADECRLVAGATDDLLQELKLP
jgi:ParB-like chromosome segregation protein Spo0J